jgi:phosphoenolpyruvate synthase/pyruvate phosphate dikinase
MIRFFGQASVGALSIHGGMTTHAAVIMRSLGRSAVTGARNMTIKLTMTLSPVVTPAATGVTGDRHLQQQYTQKPNVQLIGKSTNGKEIILQEGDIITIDGSTGCVYSGDVPTVVAGITICTLIFII